jgi:hypothetical protein
VKRAIDSAASTVACRAAREKSEVARIAALLAEVDRDADALVAVVFDGLDLAAAHRHRLAEALGDIRLAGAGAARPGMVEYVLRHAAQGVLRKTETWEDIAGEGVAKI